MVSLDLRVVVHCVGVQPAASTDFLTDSVALAALQQGLVEFFGAALGCSDGSIPPYSV
jgi:hypothetical protein